MCVCVCLLVFTCLLGPIFINDLEFHIMNNDAFLYMEKIFIESKEYKLDASLPFWSLVLWRRYTYNLLNKVCYDGKEWGRCYESI